MEKLHYIEKRSKRIILTAIDDLQLDLQGQIVITEAASGLFALTPLIALMAGAKKVVCLTRDTKYGSFEEVRDHISKLCDMYGLSQKPIITQDRNDPELRGGHIVTNLGMVRPLNNELLQAVGDQSAVIPYMCEAWELRPGDVDFDYCKEHDIPVMGTNENDPRISVFSQCGMLAVKMLLEAGLEVIGNRVAILSSDHFGPVIHQALLKSECEAELFTSSDRYQGIDSKAWDAVIVADYNIADEILGREGIIKGDRLERLMSGKPAIIQFAGANDKDMLANAGCLVYPDIHLEPHRMSRTLADLGPRPLIYLHTAGLKVGSEMSRAKQAGLVGKVFNEFVLSNAPAQIID